MNQKQTDLLTPNGVRDSQNVSGVSREQIRVLKTTKFLDAWIPETRVLIEHKSRGVNLDAPQAGHGGLTPYEQAVEYDNARNRRAPFQALQATDHGKPLISTLLSGMVMAVAHRGSRV